MIIPKIAHFTQKILNYQKKSDIRRQSPCKLLWHNQKQYFKIVQVWFEIKGKVKLFYLKSIGNL